MPENSPTPECDPLRDAAEKMFATMDLQPGTPYTGHSGEIIPHEETTFGDECDQLAAHDPKEPE